MASETQWYYAQGGQQHGPVSIDTLRQLLSQSHVNSGDLVWSEGMNDWTPAARVPGLVMAPAAPAPPPAPPQIPSSVPVMPAQPVAANYGAQPVSANYGAHAIPYYPTGQSYHGFAIAGLVLSILPNFAIFGLIFSLVALSGMKKSGNLEGHGLAKAGLTISCIWLGLAVLLICIWFTIAIVIVSVARH